MCSEKRGFRAIAMEPETVGNWLKACFLAKLVHRKDSSLWLIANDRGFKIETETGIWHDSCKVKI